MNKTLEIFERCNSAQNLDELWEILHRELSQYGVSNIFYGLAHSPKSVRDIGMIDAGWFKSSYPEEYQNYFDDSFNIDDDLCAVHCITSRA